MDKVVSIFPADNFSVAAKNAAEELVVGMIIGYDKDGDLLVYGGGLLDGKRPVSKDWLWMAATFKAKLIAGDYFDT